MGWYNTNASRVCDDRLLKQTEYRDVAESSQFFAHQFCRDTNENDGNRSGRNRSARQVFRVVIVQLRQTPGNFFMIQRNDQSAFCEFIPLASERVRTSELKIEFSLSRLSKEAPNVIFWKGKAVCLFFPCSTKHFVWQRNVSLVSVVDTEMSL